MEEREIDYISEDERDYRIRLERLDSRARMAVGEENWKKIEELSRNNSLVSNFLGIYYRDGDLVKALATVFVCAIQTNNHLVEQNLMMELNRPKPYVIVTSEGDKARILKEREESKNNV